MTTPLVSVLMPVYNHARHLAEAIESVLAQTYPAVELIVLDDGSTDGSGEIARRYVPRLRYAHQPNAGIGAARNHAASLATGAFIAFLDSDDRYPADRLERQMAAFRQDPDLELVLGHVREFLSPELDETARRGRRPPLERAPGNIPPSMLIRRDTYARAGPFDITAALGSSIEWWARVLDLGLRTVMLEDVVVERRLHADNTGLREWDAGSAYLRVLKATLDRRRGAGS
jgi:glycosyltransferase involved in cell wall biosynthesis